MPFSNENFTDIRNGTKQAFEDLAAVITFRQVLPQADGTPEQVRLGIVTTNFFRVLGTPVVAGRDFDESDGIPQAADAGPAGTGQSPAPTPPNMAILSHEYWQRRYGSNLDVIGQTVAVRGPAPFQIVGVLAPRFRLLFAPADNVEENPDIWIANRLTYDNANRNGYGLRPIARLRPGVPIARAQEEVEVVAAEIRRPGVSTWYEAHVSAGATRTAHRWALAEGYVSRDSDTFVLIGNASNAAGIAHVKVSSEQTSAVVRDYQLEPHSRTNVWINADFQLPDPTAFSTLVESDTDIVVERAMYWHANGQYWAAGTAALAVPLPDVFLNEAQFTAAAAPNHRVSFNSLTPGTYLVPIVLGDVSIGTLLGTPASVVPPADSLGFTTNALVTNLVGGNDNDVVISFPAGTRAAGVWMAQRNLVDGLIVTITEASGGGAKREPSDSREAVFVGAESQAGITTIRISQPRATMGGLPFGVQAYIGDILYTR